RLVTDRVSEVGEGSDDAIVAPGAILLRHANDQRLQLWIEGGTPRSLALLGAIKLLGHKFAVPAKNRLGLDDVGDFLQSLLAQLLTDLGKGLALAVTQSYTSLEL